mmetsp:Transcript_100183/g.283673  ORF Transcript_100183/g.283673 Transcript_100183/m.283673 type:complete len:272 (-) Transcript_100183:29-844(-)
MESTPAASPWASRSSSPGRRFCAAVHSQLPPRAGAAAQAGGSLPPPGGEARRRARMRCSGDRQISPAACRILRYGTRASAPLCRRATTRENSPQAAPTSSPTWTLAMWMVPRRRSCTVAPAGKQLDPVKCEATASLHGSSIAAGRSPKSFSHSRLHTAMSLSHSISCGCTSSALGANLIMTLENDTKGVDATVRAPRNASSGWGCLPPAAWQPRALTKAAGGSGSRASPPASASMTEPPASASAALRDGIPAPATVQPLYGGRGMARAIEP